MLFSRLAMVNYSRKHRSVIAVTTATAFTTRKKGAILTENPVNEPFVNFKLLLWKTQFMGGGRESELESEL